MDIEQLRIKLNRKMLQSSKSYQILEENDKIMVAISGGKDSYTLLDLLWRAKARVPFHFDLIAVHLDQQQPGYDGKPLENWLKNSGIPYEILSVDTYSIVKELTPEGGTYCAPCSRLRRGILYSAAERLGCNKIALGHHRDDALETLLMNLFYSGKLQAMPAKYHTDDHRFEVIRPLIECGEDEIASYAQAMAFPILPCNLCGSQEGLKREQMTQLINQLQKSHPGVREVMLGALKNVKPSHLLDPKLLKNTKDWENGAEPEVEEARPALVQIEG
jgi:tRNA 2-thiocytidine biosynthesis protein TtcA